MLCSVSSINTKLSDGLERTSRMTYFCVELDIKPQLNHCGFTVVIILDLKYKNFTNTFSTFVLVKSGTDTADSVKDGSFYNYGIKDLFAIFFYGLICIVFHAVFQEYIFDVR